MSSAICQSSFGSVQTVTAGISLVSTVGRCVAVEGGDIDAVATVEAESEIEVGFFRNKRRREDCDDVVRAPRSGKPERITSSETKDWLPFFRHG